MQTISDPHRNQLSKGGPALAGYVVETIIEGELAWLIEPVPLERYTFTFELEKAHVFPRYEHARDSRASVWCSLDRHGMHPHLEVYMFNDDYRAKIASFKDPGE